MPEAIGVPNSLLNLLDQASVAPQARHSGLRIEVPHPKAGSVPLTANPIKFSRTPLSYEVPPLLVGEHVENVLRGMLGKSDAEIATLREKKIV